jgi:hypothetical protein
MGICFFLADNLHDVLRLIVAGHKRCFVAAGVCVTGEISEP